MEPSLETYQEIGRLCAAWAYLEMRSEQTLWGILSLNPALARAFVWRMPLLQRWQAIVREAKGALSEIEFMVLKEIGRRINLISKDRNIIVHGVVHATVGAREKLPSGSIVGDDENPPSFSRIPCWTIFIGDDAGKSFPVSKGAVEIVRTNIQQVAAEVVAFNQGKGFTTGTIVEDVVRVDWPKPL
jgi:hypothetical protein